MLLGFLMFQRSLYKGYTAPSKLGWVNRYCAPAHVVLHFMKYNGSQSVNPFRQVVPAIIQHICLILKVSVDNIWNVHRKCQVSIDNILQWKISWLSSLPWSVELEALWSISGQSGGLSIDLSEIPRILSTWVLRIETETNIPDRKVRWILSHHHYEPTFLIADHVSSKWDVDKLQIYNTH